MRIKKKGARQPVEDHPGQSDEVSDPQLENDLYINRLAIQRKILKKFVESEQTRDEPVKDNQDSN